MHGVGPSVLAAGAAVTVAAAAAAASPAAATAGTAVVPASATALAMTCPLETPSAAAPSSPAAAGAAALRLVPGFFVHDMEPPPPPFPPHMGLAPGKTWQDVNELVRESQQRGPKVKLVVLLRHGEGVHNADKARVGSQAWDDDYQFRAEYIDAPLTALGEQQSERAAKVLEEEVAHGGMLIERVIVSPLDRTLGTFERAFANLPQYPVTAVETARETLGVCPCDQRKPMHTKVSKYPQVDFSGIEDDLDVLWTPDHRESDAEIEQRALAFLGELYAQRPESHFVVVSHSGFTRGCLRALGRRHSRPKNTEFIPLLITAADASVPQ